MAENCGKAAQELRRGFLSSPETFTHVARDVMTRRSTLLVYISVLLFAYLFMLSEPYENRFAVSRTLVFLGWFAVAWIVPYLWAGAMARWAAARNLSLYWLLAVMFFALTTAQLFCVRFAISGMESWWSIWRSILATTLMTSAGLFVVILLIRDDVGPKLSSRPELFPWFWPATISDAPLAFLLPEDVRGTVLRLESQNQYVRVTTDRGSAMLRMPLSAACDMTPNGAGWRVHRSLWVAKSEARAVVFEGGNPRLVDSRGERLPISRQAAPMVKDWLAASNV